MNVIDYVQHLAEVAPADALIVSSHTANTVACLTTGLADRAFLGFNMGFATPIGLGLALALPHRRVIILEGDGDVLLLTSALADLAAESPPNVVVVVADNESNIGFPSHTARKADLAAMARGAGIEHACTVRSLDEFKVEFGKALSRPALSYVVAKTEQGGTVFFKDSPMARKRPLPLENTFQFVRHLEETEGISILKAYGGP